MISSWGHYALTRSAAGLQLQQFATGTYDAAVLDGQARLRVSTDYPWDGEVEVTVVATPDQEWELAIRVPAWCENADVAVNGTRTASLLRGGYVRLERPWKEGDTVRLSLEMPIRQTTAHPRVDAVRGTIALQRGPLVYCVEQADLPAGIELEDVSISGETAGLLAKAPAPINGAALTVQGTAAAGTVGLYRTKSASAPGQTPVEVRAVPYFAWGNRRSGSMRVWIPVEGEREAEGQTASSNRHDKQNTRERESHELSTEQGT